jgi:hypothetical protein
MDWILHLLAQLGATSIYNAIADLHTLQIIATNTKSSPDRKYLQEPFPGNGF